MKSWPRSFLDGRVILHAGDCREVLKTIADNSVDSVVTDPPYCLRSITKRFGDYNAAPAKYGKDGSFARVSRGFMSKAWDDDVAFHSELWADVLRVLKPGGYIMAFSGCRTYHRVACAIEDAGFITHPFFAWAFGSGFPKAHSVSKQIGKAAGAERKVVGVGQFASRKPNGSSGVNSCGLGYYRGEVIASATDAAREWDGWFYGTQSCKPAVEPIYFGQKPFERGLNGAQNVLKWGTGAINVGGCKIPHMAVPNGTLAQNTHLRANIKATTGFFSTGSEMYFDVDHLGRWPANLMHDGSEEVLACFPDSDSPRANGNPNERTKGTTGMFKAGNGVPDYRDSGSAARFFASFPQEGDVVGQCNADLANAIIDNAEALTFLDNDNVKRIRYGSKADADDRLGSKHPTVKPLALIQYQVRMITPKNGVCLDLFAGTGTTGEAAFREGFRVILIEREVEYIADIERRMALVMEGPVTRAHAGMKARNRPRNDGPLFGGRGDQFRSKYRPDGQPCKLNLTNSTFGIDRNCYCK